VGSFEQEIPAATYRRPLPLNYVGPIKVSRRRTVATSKADEYRAKAHECEERAEYTRDPFIKQQLLEIAQK
jgi:hypothetical protein